MKNNKTLIFERMGLSSPKLTMQEEVPKSGNLISKLQDAYYDSGHFPVPTPEGGIRFIEDDQEFDEFLHKVQQSWNKISLPF